MLKAKGVSDDQIEMFVSMMEKNPELFQKIALEIQEKIKGGMSQEMAGMQVMTKYKSEIEKLRQ
jgi:hypothetical protein